MKYLPQAALLACILSAFGSVTAQTREWIDFSPAGESFRVSLPANPVSEKQRISYGRIDAEGSWFTATGGEASYAVWSLRNRSFHNEPADDDLDACAELVWEDLFKPARDNVPEAERRWSRMTYIGELSAEPMSGREYRFTVGGTLTGTTQFYIGGERIYILTVMGPPGGNWPRQKFFASFIPSGASIRVNPVIAGSGLTAIPDDKNAGAIGNRIFGGTEVTQRPRLLEKPEPTYTESARKFAVYGTVVMRGVFSKEGEVTNLHVIRKLPHGLTEQALKAARSIKFTPATKDGQPVSMWMELQYNFNLY